jgi:class 3 adenylate cyclase
MATETTSPRRKLSAIVMVDVSGFSRMMGRDEEGTTARIRELQLRIRSIVESYEGRIVDTAGDSAFGEFDSVINAVRCAQAIQSAQAADNVNRPPEEQIQTRIGVHLGDVIVQDYQVYGDGVNIAARLQSLADPGGICISEAVYQQVFQKLGLNFEDLGIQKLKNIEYPIRLYRVVLKGDIRPKEPVQEGLQTPGPVQPVPPTGSWMEAFLTRGGLIPLALGLCLLTAPLGLFPFPQSGIAPTLGAVLIGVGFGNIWARKTGRRGYFFIALGAGIALGAVFLRWTRIPNWPLVVAGLIIVINGLRRLYTVDSSVSQSDARQARSHARRARRDARRATRRPLR